VSNYLWRIRTTSGALPERLDFAGLRVFGPSVSLTGNRLVATQGGTGFDIWRFAPETRPDDRFLASSASDVDPAYSPDGFKIVFASARSGRSQDLWLANADGTGLALLTEGLPGRLLGAPVWSPHSDRIAFNAQGEDGTWDIKVMDAVGGPARAVTADAGSENYPAWSADGQWIYFSSTRTNRAEVWRVPAAGGAETQVTTTGGSQPRIDGSTLYYRRGATLVARSIDTGQEHEIVATLAAGGSSYDAHGSTLWYVSRSPQSRDFELHVKDLKSDDDRVFDSFRGDGVLTLSVAPGGKSALLSVSRSQSDLILVENFR
jgi:Tol biopolymer transport system component